jgi:hypothetical protein
MPLDFKRRIEVEKLTSKEFQEKYNDGMEEFLKMKRKHDDMVRSR